MSKTSTFLSILYRISLSPNRCLPESTIRQLMSHPTKSTWHRQISELLKGSKEVPALLIETINPLGERLFCLNSEGWQSFLDANKEGKFLLECYRQIGYLLESDLTQMVFELSEVDRKHFDRLGRKFLHLVKIKANQTARSRVVLDTVIQGLIGERQLELTYDAGIRTVMPLTLCQYRDDLYLLCYRFKEGSQWEKRTYKLSRISGIRLLEKKFPYPPKHEWDPVKEYSSSSGLLLGEVKQVRVRIFGVSRKIIGEKKFFNGELINRDPEFDTYLFTYTNSAEFLGQLFVYAQDVQIIDDLGLREEFKNKALQALERNTQAA